MNRQPPPRLDLKDIRDELAMLPTSELEALQGVLRFELAKRHAITSPVKETHTYDVRK